MRIFQNVFNFKIIIGFIIWLSYFYFLSCNYKEQRESELSNLDSNNFIKLYEPYRPFFVFKIYNEKTINQYLADQKAGIAKNEIIVHLNDKRLEELFFNNFEQHNKITYMELNYFKSPFSIIKFNQFSQLKNLNFRYSEIDNQSELFLQLSKLNKLETIFIFESIKNISLAPMIGKLIRLKNLSIVEDSLKTLPNELGQLTNLNYLYLNCNLEILPNSLVNLQKLKQLDIGYNSFKEFPEVILSLKNLEELIIEANEIDYIPDEIIRLKKLKKIGIFYTSLYEKLMGAELIKCQLKEISDSSNIKFSFEQSYVMPK